MTDDLSPALDHVLQAFRHEPPPGATDAAQVQAVFAMLQETLALPSTLDRAIWAMSLLSTLRAALTTLEEWQQWGDQAVTLLEELMRDYRHYRAEDDA